LFIKIESLAKRQQNVIAAIFLIPLIALFCPITLCSLFINIGKKFCNLGQDVAKWDAK
jgi:hypothetical protein